MNLLSLPNHILENIFSYVSYHDIARCRSVSKSFNALSMRLLNKGFEKVQYKQENIYVKVRNEMLKPPISNIESPLSRRFSVLLQLAARIKQFHREYYEYIKNYGGCFIPGRILDELLRLIDMMESTENPPPESELLQNLIYLSYFAIKHFRERIKNDMKKPQNKAPGVIASLLLLKIDEERRMMENNRIMSKLEMNLRRYRGNPRFATRQKIIRSKIKILKVKNIILAKSVWRLIKESIREIQIYYYTTVTQQDTQDNPVAGPSTRSQEYASAFRDTTESSSSDDE